MYLEEQKLLLCGIDHGFSTMKTAHFVFENGVKELGGEASLLTNTMFFNERYFKVGEGRLPLKDTKVEDGDYFLLTLAAIAREMDYHGLSDTEVCIAAGLPFTRFGQEKTEFKEYLNPGDREFQYNGKEYHIKCSDVFLYPQCYAAVADRLGKLPAGYYSRSNLEKEPENTSIIFSGSFLRSLISQKRIIPFWLFLQVSLILYMDFPHTVCAMLYVHLSHSYSRFLYNFLLLHSVRHILLSETVRIFSFSILHP